MSLVRAQSENDLMDLIDASGSPNDCTWKMYNGPVWLDFDLPGVELRKDHDGPLELNDCHFTSQKEALPTIEPIIGEEDEPYQEMREELVKWAFPNLWKTIDKILEDSMGAVDSLSLASNAQREEVSRAIARDEVRHADRLMEKNLTFDRGGGLARTTQWYLQRTPSGFSRVRASKVERFCFGRARLGPDSDGYVRIALLQSHWSVENGNRVVRLASAIRLRTNGDGIIDPVHRADAFVHGGESAVLQQFNQRRNAGVQWRLDEEEWQELNDFFRRRMGVPITENDE